MSDADFLDAALAAARDAAEAAARVIAPHWRRGVDVEHKADATPVTVADRELVLGVSSAPHFGETAWARRGGGAWLDDVRIRCAETTRLAEAAISFGNLKTLARGPQWPVVAGIVRDANRTRGYGDFYHYHLLARGALDAVVESDVNILDIAPLVVLAREAGAVFTDLQGREPGLDTTSVLAATPAIHAELLRRFAAP
jgi:histidinol-phosphatase